jgi:hypothetical protein
MLQMLVFRIGRAIVALVFGGIARATCALALWLDLHDESYAQSLIADES